MSANITRSEDHIYTVDGKPWPGVTTIIGTVVRKPGLERWIGQVGNEEAERVRSVAARHGTMVHGLAALVVSGLPSIPMGEEDDLPTKNQVDAFTAWFEATVEEVHAVEFMVASTTYRYAGTLDFLFRLRGDKRPTLVDLKSGHGVYAETRYQTAGYREPLLDALEEWGYSRRDCRRGVLHVPRDIEGPAKFYPHTRHAADFQGFLSCLYLYHDLKRGI